MSARTDDTDIAVVGLACRTPAANDPETFWSSLAAGVETLRPLADDEIEPSPFWPGDTADPAFVKVGHVLTGVDLFDANFFGYSGTEAELIDPQQRLLLECAWEAFESAGWTPGADLGRVAVYAGTGMNTYLPAAFAAATSPAQAYLAMIGNDKDYAATRLSYKLGLRGESVTVQTACSTGLVAIHLACQSLLSGQADAALAGAAAVLLPQRSGYLHQEGMVLSRDGHCRFLDRDGRGFAPGRAVGAVLMKPLGRARADRDTIWAIIKGSAVNNDGRGKAGFTAPSAAAQTEVITAAQAFAGTPAETIGYVEAHGTATPLGDAVELTALTQAFRAGTSARGFCAVGSVKTNLGHTDVAAGLMGFIKTVLALRHGALPPSLHFQTPNPHIRLEEGPFVLNTVLREWPRGATPRRAGVSSFGVGGTNVHVVLEEAPEPPPEPASRPAHLLVLSARTPAATRVLAARHADHLARDDAAALADVCYTAAIGRVAQPDRLAVVGHTAAEMVERLRAVAAGRDTDGAWRGHVADGARPRLWWLFPDRGGAGARVGRALCALHPGPRTVLERVEAMVAGLRGVWSADIEVPLALAPIAQLATAVALAAWWRAWGPTPDGIAGVGMGALAARCARDSADVDSVFAALLAGNRGGVDTAAGDDPTAGAADADVVMIAAGAAPVEWARADATLLPMAAEGDVTTRLLEVAGRVWLAGAAVDWRVLDPDGECRRTSLPTYPFERQRYWVGGGERERAVHPLLDAEVAGADGERVFEKHFDERRDPLLGGHRVADRATLPASAFFEMAAAAARACGDVGAAVELRDVTIVAPLTAGREGRVVARIAVSSPSPSGARRFQVRSHADDAKGDPTWTEHATGVVVVQGSLGPPLPTLTVRPQAAPDERLPGDAVYDAGTGGVVHGAALRAIAWLRRDGGVARLRSPSPATGRFDLDPVLFDAALKAAGNPFLGAAIAGDAMYLPFSVARIRSAGTMPVEVDCTATAEPSPAAGSDPPRLLRRRAVLSADDGRVVAELDGIVFVRATSTSDVPAVLDLARHPLARDHRLHGTPVVPGATLLVLMAAAGGGTSLPRVFADVELTRPLAGHDRRRLRVERTAGNVVAVTSSGADQRWIEHARGRVVDEAPAAPDAVDAGAIAARCPRRLSRDAFEAAVAALGVETGDTYRAIEEMTLGEGEALARLVRGQHDAGPVDAPCPPALLHGMLGVLSALVPPAGDGAMYVPVAVERVVFHRSPPAVAWCHAVRRAPAPNGAVPRILRFDATLFDDDGAVCVAMTGIVKQRVADGTRLGPAASLVHEIPLAADREPVVGDHRVAGVAVLPGVAYVDLALVAARRLLGVASCELRDLVMTRPLAANRGAVTLRVTLAPRPGWHATHRFTIASLGHRADDVVEHATGEVVDVPPSPAEPLDLAAIRRRCTRDIDPDAAYAAMAAGGVEYGSYFRSVRRFSTDGLEALLEVAVPASIGEEPHVLHPVLLDAATQGISLLLAREVARDPLVPVAVDRVRLYAESSATAVCHVVRLGAPVGADSAVHRFALTVCDPDGRVTAALEVVERRIPRAALAGAAPAKETDGLRRLFHEVAWKPQSLAAAVVHPRRRWLVLIRRGGIGGAVVERLRRRGEDVVTVEVGAGFEEVAGGFRLRPEHRDDVRALARVLRGRDRWPTDVLHLWSCEPATAGADAGFDAQGVDALVLLAQELLRDGPQATTLWIVTAHAVVVGNDRPVTPSRAPLAGIARVIPEEMRGVSCHCVDLDLRAGGLDAAVSDIVAELDAPRSERHTCIAYDGGIRLAPGLVPAAIDDSAPCWRNGGVYLITGGTGGLGFAVAGSIAARVRARLVLVSRRGWAGQDDRAGELEALGAEVMVCAADVADPDAMAAVVMRVRQRWGRIDGVVHAAGVADARFLCDQTLADVAAVLRPKVDGTLVLDRVLGDAPLDLLVVFSSLVTVPGYANAGNAAYAGANAFLDAWTAAALRRGRARCVVSLRWSLWGEVGMAASAAVIAGARGKGIRALDTATGLRAFHAALGGGGADRVIADLMSPAHEGAAASPGPEVSQVAADASDRGARRARFVQRLLREHLIETLKLESAAVGVRVNFQEMGMDSLMAVLVRRTLEDRLRVRLDPVLLFEFPTIESLAVQLASAHPEAVDALAGEVEVAVPANPESAAPPAKPEPSAPPARAALPAPEPDVVRATDIAIIGMACRFPGAPELDAFWALLRAGRDAIGDVPDGRWHLADYCPPGAPEYDAPALRRGGFLADVDRFDPLFFGMAPREARFVDPQQRLVLETAWATLEHAGYAGDPRARHTGVFVGVSSNEYLELLARAGLAASEHAGTGNGLSLVANRVSYLLDLTGPSMSVDTACSSSLVALDMACRHLRAGSCEQALVAGVNLILTPLITIGFHRAGMLAPDARCKTFDAGADGYVRGEGVGAVLLKPLARALADGDRVWAVVRGTAVNHDGHAKVGLTAPSPRAQRDVVRSAQREAGVEPGTITYVEAHGTGTALGDAIELRGLTDAFRDGTTARGFCGIGSVKTNIGHLESAAGIASVIKVALALHHGEIPPSLHLETPNPSIPFDETPFVPVTTLRPWGSGAAPRRAGISSFGFGGANAHLILEEAPLQPRSPRRDPDAYLLVISARSAATLAALVARYQDVIASDPELPLVDLCFTAAAGRPARRRRLAIVFHDRAGLLARLAAASRQTDDGDVFTGTVAVAAEGATEGPPLTPPPDADATALRAVARAWVAGREVTWGTLFHSRAPRRVPLPASPFERQRYWVEVERGGARPTADGAGRATAAARPAPPREQLISTVCRRIAVVLNLSPETVGPGHCIADAGLDAVAAVRISRAVEAETGLSLAPAALFDCRTVGDVVDRLLDGAAGHPLVDCWEVSLPA